MVNVSAILLYMVYFGCTGSSWHDSIVALWSDVHVLKWYPNNIWHTYFCFSCQLESAFFNHLWKQFTRIEVEIVLLHTVGCVSHWSLLKAVLLYSNMLVLQHICQRDVSLRTSPWPQSYRKKHSTETAVLKVITDVLRAADRGEVSLLCMLDLSAAFDTVDHDILIERLQQSFGVRGLALSWIESFALGLIVQLQHWNKWYYVLYAGSYVVYANDVKNS